MDEILTRMKEMCDEILMIKERISRARSRGEQKLFCHLMKLKAQKKLRQHAFKMHNFTKLYGNQNPCREIVL